jgi:NAD(P)-dependent dehydrogenase (short-subunit alcohol dehydrogenase family)
VIDVLINNGAPWLPGSIEDLADADIAATIAAAVTGTVLITKGLLPGLRRSSAADIVTIVSTAGLPGQNLGSASAAFHAAKHGQSGFSQRLHGELKKYGIRVSAVYPPDFDDTDPLDAGWHEVRDPAAGAKLTNREVVAAVMFAITAPRVCAYPIIVLDNMLRE